MLKTSRQISDLLTEESLLLGFLIHRFELQPIEQLNLLTVPATLGALHDPDMQLQAEWLHHPSDSDLLQVTFVDTRHYWLGFFRGYCVNGRQETPPRFTMHQNPTFEPCYRLLLALEIAAGMVGKMQLLGIGGVVDIRFSTDPKTGQDDYAGFVFVPSNDGTAKLSLSLLSGLCVSLRPKG